MNNNIILIGFMGTGKSTVSKRLAAFTGYEEVDLDSYIEQSEGKTIKDIFAESGEEGFRSLETKYLLEISQKSSRILSCGGGTPLRNENVDIMKANGTVVLLTATPQSIYARVKDTDDRPLLNGNMSVEYIETLMKRREKFYVDAADIIIATDNLEIDEISRQILDKMQKNG